MADPQVTAPAQGESQQQVVDNNVGSPNPSDAGARSAPLMQRPEWVPEKFFKEGVIDYQSLAKSYVELEKAKGAPAPVAKKEETPAPKKDEPKDETFSIPGVQPASITRFTEELNTTGALSDASYAELLAAGYPKSAVDTYVAGITRDAAISQAVEGARIADTEIKSIMDTVGGQEQLNTMLSWATSTLSAEDLKAYNEAVSSTDPARVRMAVNALNKAFADEHGHTPNYLNQNNPTFQPTHVEPYASNDDVAADMAKREYKTSEAFRKKVAARLAVSDVFQQSKDSTKTQRWQS